MVALEFKIHRAQNVNLVILYFRKCTKWFRKNIYFEKNISTDYKKLNFSFLTYFFCNISQAFFLQMGNR